MLSRSSLFITVMCMGLGAGTAKSQEICTGILSYTGRDLTRDSRNNYVAKSIYDDYCQGNSARSSAATSVGIEAVVKAIPIKFNFGGNSAQEQLSNFCRNYNTSFQAYSQQEMDSSVVVRKALSAFNECIGLSKKDVYFKPVMGRTNVSVDLSRGARDVQLQGIVYRSSDLSCMVPGAEGLVKADEHTTKSLDGNSLPITCTRIPQSQPDGTQVYTGTELTVATNQGTLILPVPQDAVLPESFASDISQRLGTIENGLNNLRKEVPQIAFGSLTFKVYTSGLKPPDAYAECQDKEHEILVGGSCLNRSAGAEQPGNVDANQVGLGPVYRSPGVVPPVQTLDRIRCQRYTGDQNLRVEAFAVCMRLK